MLSAINRKRLKPAHGRYAAAKLGVRGLQVTGIPMAAYGAYNLVKPDKKVPRVNAKDDIARQVARGVTFRDAADDYRKRVAKRQLTQAESEKLVRRKKSGTALSLAAGTMGLGALALRSPEVARAVASRSRRLAGKPKVKRLIAFEPGATKVSNTLGIAAIGTGSAGSFNYASQQRLEAKQVRKGLPDRMRHAGKMRRVLGYDSKTKQIILDNPADPTTPYRVARGGKKPPKPPAEPTQMRLPFGKRDDKFLRRYKDRISPDAERGYNSMRRQRNKDRAWAVGQTGLAGLNAAGTVAAVRARSKPFTVLGAGLTAFSGAQAVKHGSKARGYDKGPMEGIRRKARAREQAGLYGPGRGKEPVDASSKRVGKALVPRIAIPRSLPKGLRRTPGIRRAYVARRPSGRMVSVRGGFG